MLVVAKGFPFGTRGLSFQVCHCFPIESCIYCCMKFWLLVKKTIKTICYCPLFTLPFLPVFMCIISLLQ